MTDGKRLHIKKRLLRTRPLAPGSLAGGLVPRLPLAGGKVIVGLTVVGAVIPRLLQYGGPRLDSIRQGGFPMILKATSGGQNARGESGTGNRTYRPVGKGVVEGKTLFRHLLDMGHRPELGSIMLEVMNRVIFRHEKDDVGLLGPNQACQKKGKEQREDMLHDKLNKNDS